MSRGKRSPRLRAAAAGAAVGAGVSYQLNRLARGLHHRGGGSSWLRTNHAGRDVSLLEGPAATAGMLAGVAVEGLLDDHPDARRRAAATAVAVAGSAVVGMYDDRSDGLQAKGFRGHLRALSQGRVTSGMIKVLGVGTAALTAALIDRPGSRRPVEMMINTALIAGTANLVNLLDLRPGRAAKVIIAAGTLTPGGMPAAAAAAGALPDDLAGRSMLGDCGANALGAGLGTALARLPLPVRLIALGAVAGLNLASEKVSFTAVIERQPVLRTVDEWGRAPRDR